MYMFWKVLSRTIHSALGIGGLMMQGFGLYFDIVQVTETPEGPFGISILGWGVILFTVFSISVIAQLWWHIRGIEDSYQYALSFDGLKLVLPDGIIQVALELSNTLDKVVEYRFDCERFNIDIGGNRPIQPRFGNTEAIIPRNKPSEYRLPGVHLPGSFPCKGVLHYELTYGPPKKPLYRQIREMNLDFNTVGEQMKITWTFTKQEDIPIKK